MLQITVLFASLYVVIIDKIFIQHMNSYLLTEIQLVENGYPRPSGEPGIASIVRKPDDVNDIKPVGPNGMHTHTHTYTHTHTHIHTHAHYMHAHIRVHRTRMHLTSMYLQRYKILLYILLYTAQRHTCCRCGKPFIIYNSGSYQSTEECCYHFKRLQKRKGIYMLDYQ